MRDWRLDISEERADQLAYLFHLISEFDLLIRPEIDRTTIKEMAELSEWYLKAYDKRKAFETWKAKWG